MNLRKAPQDHSTPKRLDDRERGHPDIVLKADGHCISLHEAGEEKWPPVLRGADEVRDVRDYLDAWLERHEELQEDA